MRKLIMLGLLIALILLSGCSHGEICEAYEKCSHNYKPSNDSNFDCVQGKYVINQTCIKEFGKDYCESINQSFYGLHFRFNSWGNEEITFNCLGEFNRVSGKNISRFYFSVEELKRCRVMEYNYKNYVWECQ